MNKFKNLSNYQKKNLLIGGLMNVSDYIKANTNTEQCGSMELNNNYSESCTTTNWIYTGPMGSNFSWTIAPYSNSYAYDVFFVDSDDTLYHYYAGNRHGVVPVLYLSSDISLNGEGTQDNPYTVE